MISTKLDFSFHQSVEEAGKYVSSFRAEVRDADLSPDQRAVLQKAIDAKFKVGLSSVVYKLVVARSN